MVRFALTALTCVCIAACDAPNAGEGQSEGGFVTNAASAGMLELWIGNGAVSRASSEDVRQLAYGILADHRSAYRGLEKAAQNARLELPDEMVEEHQDEYFQVTALRGDEFDRAYLKALIERQEAELADCKAEAARSQSDVAKWAAERVPALEKQLARARELSARTSTVAAVPPWR